MAIKEIPSWGAQTSASGGEPWELLRLNRLERFAAYAGMSWTPDSRAVIVVKVVATYSPTGLTPAAPQPTQPNPAGVAAPSDPGEAANAYRYSPQPAGRAHNERMRATAMIFSEFQIDERYFGKEFGGKFGQQ